MKKNFMNLIALFALMITPLLGTASAESVKLLEADIPFDFVVNNKTMPAGRYLVTRQGQQNIVVLQNQKISLGVASLGVVNAAKKVVEHGQLQFRRYGDQYFLAHVLAGSSASGLALTTCHRERQVIDETRHLAGMKPEVVTITAE